MDPVQYQYLRINKYLMYSIGQWPYQTFLEKILVGVVFIPIIASQTILQGGGMWTGLSDGDVEAFLEGFAPFIISWMCLCGYINYMYNMKTMKHLLNVMQEDWKIYSKSEIDYEILCRNYAVGKRISINYTAILFGTMTPFMLVPSVMNAADALGLVNITSDRQLMFRIEHFVDAETHYYPLLIHSYFGTIAFITMVVAVDSMVVVYIQHECGLCEILGRRLKNFVEGDNLDTELYPDKREDTWYQNARKCIILHKHILEFGKTIEDANTTSYLFKLGFNMIGVSFTQFQAVVNLERPNQSLRYGCFTACLLSILLLESWHGQQLADFTGRIFEYTTSGKWYQTSLSTRKLLNLMLLRSINPLRLTAGKLYILNLESFAVVVKTSFSYCMVLCSTQ